MNKRLSPLTFGFLGFLVMILFYYIILVAVTSDYLHPFLFFKEKWFLLGPLFIGFGVQMYLFQKLRIIVKENSLKMAGTSVGTSATAMAACCAHHLAEIFPLLGLFGAAAFVTKYQDWFLAAGLFMNIIGAVYMFIQLKKHSHMSCCTHVKV